MVIVVDTNILTGACLGVGTCNGVVAACLRGEHEPLMAVALFAEYEDVLGRPALFEGCRLSGAEREALFDIYLSRCRWTRIYLGWRPNLVDEGDNHLIELAVAGGAEAVVTRNVRDFERAELRLPHLRFRTPEALLQENGP
jgi:predicted nucleic acid-binding protein